MNKTIIFLAIPLLFSGCKKLFEPYDKRTYYDVTGVGYVYYKDTKEPAPGVQVFVQSSFRSNGYATVQPIQEYYPVDNTGYFCVKFLKRTERENVRYCFIAPIQKNYYSEGLPNFTAEELQNATGTIQIDTLWLYPVWQE